jgi:hypothetical protein
MQQYASNNVRLVEFSQSGQLSVMLNTHPPINDRLTRLAEQMDGQLDSFASGRTNPERFRHVALIP